MSVSGREWGRTGVMATGRATDARHIGQLVTSRAPRVAEASLSKETPQIAGPLHRTGSLGSLWAPTNLFTLGLIRCLPSGGPGRSQAAPWRRSRTAWLS